MKNKKETKIQNIKDYLIAIIVLSTSGFLTLLLTDFAGWYHSNYYIRSETWGDIYFGSGVLTTLIMMPLLIIIAFTSISLWKMMKKENTTSKQIIEKINQTIKHHAIILSILFVSALIFIIKAVWDDTEEWWLSTGFYIPFVASIAIIVISKAIIKRMK